MDIGNTFKKDLGVRGSKLSELSSKPNCVSSQAMNDSKKVNPLKYSGDLKEQMDKVVNVISGMSGVEVKQKSDNYLYAVFTTKIMRFKDDVEIYLDDESKTLHFRSASRVGYSDLGVNKKRYAAFVSKL
ncbi:MAG: hypothetical protein ACI8O8_001364 [Oleiphilaceae bacterium]|jgi:uncharacterized protein (DUF1499 family)